MEMPPGVECSKQKLLFWRRAVLSQPGMTPRNLCSPESGARRKRGDVAVIGHCPTNPDW
jgi:hypothetical protein